VATFSNILRFTGIPLFVYLLVLAIGYDPSPLILVCAAALCFALTASLFLLREIGLPHPSACLLAAVVITAIALALRVTWALAVSTTPVSDFRAYHDTAIALSQGLVPQKLGNNSGYPIILSIAYRVSPSLTTGRLVNAIAGSITAVLVFLAAKRLIGPAAAVGAMLLFAVLPTEIAMVSVLGTEVLATTLLAAAFYLTVLAFCNPSRASIPLLSGLVCGMAIAVRFASVLYVPAFVLLLLAAPSRSRMRTSLGLASLATGLAVPMLAIASWHSIATSRPIAESLPYHDAFPLLSGTNIESGGMWSQADADLYASWPKDERNTRAIATSWHRITDDIPSYVLFVPDKIRTLMADNAYAHYWSVSFVDPSRWNESPSPKPLIDFAAGPLGQAFFIAVLLLALLSLLSKPIHIATHIATVATLGLLLGHLLLEVQPRYHHQLVLFLAMPAALAAARLIDRWWPGNSLNLTQRAGTSPVSQV